jgi:hypothetical protein
MALPTPVSYHFDLYAYWLAKRGSRRMPARNDLSPGEIVLLLPHLIISEREGDEFRVRLFGTGVVQDLGFDATGYFAGEYLNNPSYYAEWRAINETVCADQDPLFVTGEFRFESIGSGAHHAWSAIILPLSDDGRIVNKLIASFVGRLHSPLAISRDWLESEPAKVLKIVDFKELGSLKQLCFEWERALG